MLVELLVLEVEVDWEVEVLLEVEDVELLVDVVVENDVEVD